MPKYIANPVEVEALKIVRAYPLGLVSGEQRLELENGKDFQASADMLCRLPQQKANEGDYLVMQSDGYQYLNPREVFERKYRPVDA